MKEIKFDITIVGAGMTGLLAALSLSKTDYRILIIDRNKYLNTKNDNTDVRTTAISQGSKNFLSDIGLWKNINTEAEIIKRIKVYDRSKINEINFFNFKLTDPLGYIVKNSLIKKEIIKKLRLNGNINFMEEENIEEIQNDLSHSYVFVKNKIIKTKLVIAADGKFGKIREIYQTKQFCKEYNHSAIVINFNHTKNHMNTAFEIFYKSGPMAILPMKSKSPRYFSSSLIWTNKKDYTNSIYKINEKLRKEILQERLRDFVGSILDIVDTKIFNLSAHINNNFYDERLVYIGDSAHSIHPIAGQGWNLGVRDVKNLLLSVKSADKLGLDIGSKKVCKDYHNSSFYDAYALYQVTDKLNTIFLNNTYAAKKIRNRGFNFIEKNNNLKNYITNYAMGL